MRDTLFFPVTLDGAPGTAASVRFRAQWPAKYMPGADVYPDISLPMSGYDRYVFQKAYITDRPRRFLQELRKKKKLIAFDLCDADWLLSERHEQSLLEALVMFDFAVAPTEAIASWMRTYVSAFVIRDRLDLSEFTQLHNQRDSAPTLCWFGYSHNIGVLEAMWPAIERLHLSLTLISEALPPPWDKRRGIRFQRWTRTGANTAIAAHDIALVPPASPYKSENRAITAWALGLVTASTGAELESLLDFGRRRDLAAEYHDLVRREYDVRQSAQEWHDLFDRFGGEA